VPANRYNIHVALVEERRRMTNASRRAAAIVWLVTALSIGLPESSFADPTETKPEAATKDPDYAAGKQALDDRKDWHEAVRRLEQAALRDPDNADLQNYLGYSYRHLGQLDTAFAYYRRALELNPRHRGAHEYAGEAYLMAGNVAGAEEHLAALRKICLLPCEELGDLEREIAAYKKKSGAVRTP
jgi:tetratricopeptide (TPR) repeat protein